MLFKAATYNANSVRARMGIIKDWLGKEKPDLLCLQETKVRDEDFPAGTFEDAGYKAVYRGQKSYNGVAILTALETEDLRTNLYEDQEEEARFVSAIVAGIPVINVYVPQGYAVGSEKFQYKLAWLRRLVAYITENHDPDKPLLLIGDFNVALEDRDVHDPDSHRGHVCFHPDEQKILRELIDWGLIDLFRRYEPGKDNYTFWDYRVPNALKRKMGWRIDYILCTAPLADKSRNSWIDMEPRLLEKPSDHTFLVAEFDVGS